jgi:DNA-binding MarR family transcriptional regulator
MFESSPSAERPGVPFLLSQVGAHVSARFGERIVPLGLKAAHAGILGVLGRSSGLTQQALCDLLGIFPSRLVALLDDLEELKLIERRESPSDRRTYALHLTNAGRAALAEIGNVALQLQKDICAALTEEEQTLLAELLTRIVSQQQITPAVHPGYRQMGRTCGNEEAEQKKG